MKKLFLSAIAFFTIILILGGCSQQPARQVKDGLSAPRNHERHARRPVPRKSPDHNQAVHSDSSNDADFLDNEENSSSENQDYIDVPEGQAARSATLKQEEALPSMTYVNERLTEYGKKLERWRELDRESSATAVSPEESAELISCFQQLQKVMNGYSTLRANMLDSMNTAVAKNVSVGISRDLYKTDIDFLESRCGLMLTDKPPAPKIADGPLQATEDTLLRNYAAGNYDTVTQLWQALPADQGVRLRVSAQNAAAQAMLHQGDEKGAAVIYKNLLQRLDDENSPDRLDLRRNLADISSATGDTTEAMRQYRLIDSDYRRFGDIANWAQKQAAMPVSRPAVIGAGEQRTIPKEKNERTGSAAIVDQETTRQQPGQDVQRKWNAGLQLAQNGRYDEAIGVFTDLENSDMADKARAKVQEISSQAAQDERRKAAKLYDRYTKTADVEMKKTLLLKSRRILKDILVKYPDTEITAKVTANIERVEQEIRSIAPNLLPSADQPGQEAPAYDQPQ